MNPEDASALRAVLLNCFISDSYFNPSGSIGVTIPDGLFAVADAMRDVAKALNKIADSIQERD